MEKIIRIRNLKTRVETNISAKEYDALMASEQGRGRFTIVSITETSKQTPEQFVKNIEKGAKNRTATTNENNNIEATTGDTSE